MTEERIKHLLNKHNLEKSELDELHNALFKSRTITRADLVNIICGLVDLRNEESRLEEQFQNELMLFPSDKKNKKIKFDKKNYDLIQKIERGIPFGTRAFIESSSESKKQSHNATKRHTHGRTAQFKIFIKACWDAWQLQPNRYKTINAFTEDMRLKIKEEEEEKNKLDPNYKIRNPPAQSSIAVWIRKEWSTHNIAK